jgi:hypothetical protein
MRCRSLVVALASSLTLCAIAAVSRTSVAEAAPSCRISGPMIDPESLFQFGVWQGAYAEISATNGKGVWAGVVYDGNYTFALVRWQAGHTQVLDRFSYNHDEVFGLNNEPGGPTPSVNVVGVDAYGTIVVSVQVRGASVDRHRGYRYSHGHRYPLPTSTGWVTEDPTSVAPDGTIVGMVRTGNSYYVEFWRGTLATHLTTSAMHAGYPVIASNRSVAFTADGNDPSTPYLAQGYLRLAKTGQLLRLGGTPGDDVRGEFPAGASNSRFYGAVDTQHVNPTAVSWTVGSSSPLPPRRVSNLTKVNAVGANGDVVGVPSDQVSRQYSYRNLVTAARKVYRLPAQFGANKATSGGAELPVAISPTGVVVYTAPDGKPRSVHCSG